MSEEKFESTINIIFKKTSEACRLTQVFASKEEAKASKVKTLINLKNGMEKQVIHADDNGIIDCTQIIFVTTEIKEVR